MCRARSRETGATDLLKRKRRGRLYSSASKRNQTTVEGRGYNTALVEPLLQRFRAVGAVVPVFLDDAGSPRPATYAEVREAAIVLKLIDLDVSAPLQLLLRQGKLVGKGEDPDWAPARAAAGARYARLREIHYGGQRSVQDLGYRSPLNEEEIAEIIRREKNPNRATYTIEQKEWIAAETLRRMQRALARNGRSVVAVTNAVAVHGKMPRPEHLSSLRAGLACLCAIDPVRDSDIPVLHEAA